MSPVSLTNSIIMSLTKEMAENDIDLYGVAAQKRLRRAITPQATAIIAEHRAQTLRAATS